MINVTTQNMKRCAFTVLFLMIFFLGFTQTLKDYKKLLNKNKTFYIEKVNIWMLVNSDFIDVESWNIKRVKIIVSPKEGVDFLLAEEKEKLSKFEQDSILIRNWEYSLYDLSIVVYKTNGEKGVIHFF